MMLSPRSSARWKKGSPARGAARRVCKTPVSAGRRACLRAQPRAGFCGSPARHAGRRACGACAARRSAISGVRRASVRARLYAQPCAASVRIGVHAATCRARAPSASGSAASGGGSNASKPAQLTSSPSPSSALGASANSCAPSPLVNTTQSIWRVFTDSALARLLRGSHRPVSPQVKPAPRNQSHTVPAHRMLRLRLCGIAWRAHPPGTLTLCARRAAHARACRKSTTAWSRRRRSGSSAAPSRSSSPPAPPPGRTASSSTRGRGAARLRTEVRLPQPLM